MVVFMQVIFLIFGFLMLIKGANWFVEGASGIAERFGIPQLVVGLTIVAMGTSLPETAVSITAAMKHNAGIAIGNVVGSNILNILIILGITSVITTVAVANTTIWYEIPYMIVITFLFLILCLTENHLTFWEGIALWTAFLIYLVYLVLLAKKQKGENLEKKKQQEKKIQSVWKLFLSTVIGLTVIVWGSRLTVDAAAILAKAAGISDRFIGLTIVALGTSLPELFTSVSAAVKGKADIAIGNIVGSNIFNILFILGTAALITPIPFDCNFIVDGVIAICAGILLWLLAFRQKKLVRSDGMIMLLGYAGYFIYLML